MKNERRKMKMKMKVKVKKKMKRRGKEKYRMSKSLISKNYKTHKKERRHKQNLEKNQFYRRKILSKICK